MSAGVNRMSVEDICWMVGMLEGEGSFHVQHQKGGAYPRVAIKSVDKEVVERLQKITGVGQIYTDIRGIKKPTHSTCHEWRVTNSRDVLHLICTAVSFGFFSTHRTNQILSCVEACSMILNRRFDKVPCAAKECDDNLPIGSHQNRLYCSDTCRWKVENIQKKASAARMKAKANV